MARLEEFDDVQLDVEFTQAGTRSNLTSKENIAISFGKIAKWYEALVPTGGSSGQFLGFNSSGTAKWVSNPNVDEKVKATKLAQSTSEASYYPTLVAGEGTAGVSIIDSAKINHSPGTTSIVGNTRLILGNGINEGTTNNEAGLLRIYSSGTKYHTLKGAKITTDNVDHTLPTTGGTILNTGTTSFTQTLSSGTKVGTITIDGTATDLYCQTNTNTTYTFATGDSNGQIKVTPSSGSAYNVSVKGLGSAAYTASTSYVPINGKAPNGIGRDGYVAYATDGFLNYGTGTVTGALVITTPFTKTKGEVMLKFTVDIFNYKNNTSVEYKISGYAYNDGKWYNCTAYCVSSGVYSADNIDNLTVRFGYVADGFYQVQIGETTTDKWQYPRINIHDISVAYNRTNYTDANSGWSLEFVTSENIPNITQTITNTAQQITPISVTSSTLDTTPGTFVFFGSGAPWTGSDWCGLQVGFQDDRFQIVASNGTLAVRQNDSSGTPTTTGWTEWKTLSTTGHTHNYAGSSSAGGPATNVAIARVSKDSKVFPGANKVVFEEYSPGTNYNLPGNHWYHIMSAQGNDTNYGTQLALGMTATAAYYRVYNNKTWSDWKSLINTDTTYSANNGVGLSGTTFYNSGVRAVSTGSANGTISVNTNGTSADVAVKGLASAAYTESSAYATSSHTHGLSHSNLNQPASDVTTDAWATVGIDPTVNGYVLKSIRYMTNVPPWGPPSYGAGIAFGGQDTKALINIGYASPNITFVGGNHNSSKTAPTWYIKLTGTTTATYNLDNFYVTTTSRTANTVLAAPNGSNGAATFRKLVAADIPTLNYIGAKSDGSYYGMTNPAGADNVWIRTTSLGIIPYQSGNAGSGHGSLGTSSWYFSSAYIDNIYGSLNGNATTATKATQDGDGNTISSTYLKLSGGTMTGDITFTGAGTSSYPSKSKGIYWSGGTDAIDMYYNLRTADAGELIINMRDDSNVRTSFAYNGTVKSYIDTNGTYNGNASKTGIRWNAVSQGQKWSRLYYSETAVNVEGSNGILSISCTRANVVVNAVFLVFVSHSGPNASHIIELASTNYSTIRCRVVSNSAGSYYFEIYDTANNIASGTSQAWHCCFVTLTDATLTTYTTFTDGSTIPSNFAAANDFTTTVGKASAAIKDISRNGTTFTATRQDGTTFTFTQQDNNTTYTVATGDSDGQIKVTPSGGTAYNVSVKGLASAAYTESSDYVPKTTVSSSTDADTLFSTTQWVNWNTWTAIETTHMPTTNYGLLLVKASPGPQVFFPDTGTGIYLRKKAANSDATAWMGITGNAGSTYNLANFLTSSTQYISSIASSGSGNAVTSMSVSGGKLTYTLGSTFSLSTHTHNYAGSSSAGGAATNIATEVGSSAGARPVFYAYLGDNTRVVYNTNFTYNPSGNVLTATTFVGALQGNASTATKAAQDADGNTISSTYLKLSGGTMTGQLKTSFKESVAVGSYQAQATKIPDLCTELRYSSGAMGSVALTEAYTKDGITIAAAWYNFIWIPHRSGGVNGAASGDNCNYGSLILSGMTGSGAFIIRYASGSIAELKYLYKDTTYSANNGVGLSGTTFYNSGVRAVSTGSTNGTISVNTNGTTGDVAVKGLASAAYVTQESLLRARSTVSTDGGATGWSQIGINQYNGAYPDGVTNKIYGWGAVVSMPAGNARFDLYYNHNSSTAGAITNGLQYRTGWNDDKKEWKMLLDNDNYGSYMTYTSNRSGYASSDTHILQLGYFVTDGSYDNCTILVSSAFWGNQHGSADIINYQQSNNTNDTPEIHVSMSRIRIDGSATGRRFYYKTDNTNNRVYLYVYVTGGNSYGRWNTTVLQSSNLTTYWRQNMSENQPNSGLTEIAYTGRVDYATTSTLSNSSYVVARNTTAGLTTTGIQYAVGHLTIGSADGNAKEGSNASYKLWSYPAGGTAVEGGTANIQNLRLYWSSTYFRDIFISPNNYDIYHRSVAVGTAQPWRKVLDSGNYTSYAVPIKTGGGIAECSGNGEYLYYTIATITISGAYVNHPILFEISGRGHHFTRLEVEFASSSGTDPGLDTNGFVADGYHGFWIKKTATSTWVVYGKYTETRGNAVLHRITGCGTSVVTVTVNMTNYGNSLPDGCTQVTYGWMALLADRALRADKASKLSTSSAIGSDTQPVYFDSDGYPTACYPMSRTSTIYDNSSGTSTIISDLTIPADTKYFKIFIFDFNTDGSHYITNVIDIGADDGYYGGVISGSSQSQSFPCVITAVQLIVATTSNNKKQISIGRSNSWTIGASPSSSTHTLYIRKIIACT